MWLCYDAIVLNKLIESWSCYNDYNFVIINLHSLMSDNVPPNTLNSCWPNTHLLALVKNL